MDEFGYESNTKRNAIIGAVVGVLLVAVIIVAVIVIRRRGMEDVSSTAPQGTSSTNSAAPVVDVPVYPHDLPAPETGPGDQEAVATIEGSQPPSTFDPATDRLLTDEEKAQLSYPLEWRVRLKAMRPSGGGDPFPVYVVEYRPADSDNDGLSDAKENDYGTDSGKADTDGDGWEDGYEVNVTKTDPAKSDTDGDGASDRDEGMRKTDPLDRASN